MCPKACYRMRSKALPTSRMREADVHQLFGWLLDRGAFDEAAHASSTQPPPAAR